MIEEFVQSGLARYEFKFLSYIGAHSDRVGIAMKCAVQQSGAAFWSFYDRFLVDRSSAHRRAQLISFAVDINLDEDTFTQCYDDPATKRQVEEDLSAARRIGISHGPRVLVNGVNAGTRFEGIRQQVEAATP
ncbi:MAG: thioredoxin domain-containing protein [Chloroflexi bacterium]|nr:thioredoxin domain-containing protein [Chloroflexota bacterium]MYJ58701.1 thioredoxin domain-containing protein [Chloroflexota bacterium]